jgi:acetyl-CoA acetyltransferase
MREAFICEGARTPVGRYGGSLSAVRPDDLLAHAMKAALAKAPGLPADKIDEVYAGCANQAGEDNRNVARMALLLAGLPDSVPASTVNRLCGWRAASSRCRARPSCRARRRRRFRATPRFTTRRSAGASSIR